MFPRLCFRHYEASLSLFAALAATVTALPVADPNNHGQDAIPSVNGGDGPIKRGNHNGDSTPIGTDGGDGFTKRGNHGQSRVSAPSGRGVGTQHVDDAALYGPLKRGNHGTSRVNAPGSGNSVEMPGGGM